MFYYAEINSEYKVVNKHCLTSESTNPNYILITADLYNNGNELGDIVGQFYNKLLDVIEIVDPGWDMGQTCWMRYKNSQMRFSTKLDNMEYDINNAGGVSQEDLQALEDAIDTKANANHSHTEYANASHNHDSNYAPLSHSHTDYVTSTTFNALASEVDGKANASHTHSNYATTTHNHTAEALVQMAEALFGTNYQGGVEYSYGSGSGKNVLTEISNMPQGFHTIYAIAGTTGNPETTESYRYFIHKTSTTIGWFYAFGADGSIYSNYLAGANTYKGWKTIHDAKRKPLWSSARYMTAGHTVTPSKKLSECEHGWMLLWSDYDPDTATVNNTDFCTTMIPNRNWAGSTWNGASYYCDIPRYSAGTATDSESRVIKVLTVYDNKLVGNDNNNVAPRNDVVLRAVYEF